MTARPIARYNPATMASDSATYFDLRTYRRHMKSGRLTEEEYKAHVEALPDVSDNIMDPEEGGDDDGWDARNRAGGEEAEAEAAPEAAAAPADPFAPAPAAPVAPAPAPAVSAPVVPSAPAPALTDAPAPPPPPMEVPIGAAPIIPPKVD